MLPHGLSGSGSPTLLFLHYFGGSRCEWSQVIQMLEHRYRCVAADAPGFGDARGLDAYTVEEMTQHMLSLIASLPAPVVLIGHSMMGKVGMVAASRKPDGLCGLVLVAPSPLCAEPMTEEARNTMLHGQKSEAAARAFFLNGVRAVVAESAIEQGTEDALRANPVTWRRWPQSGAREDWSGAVTRIVLPSLLLVGELDPVIPLDFQREHTFPYLRNARLEVVPSAGHLLPYEAPAELAAHIQQFVSGLQP